MVLNYRPLWRIERQGEPVTILAQNSREARIDYFAKRFREVAFAGQAAEQIGHRERPPTPGATGVGPSGVGGWRDLWSVSFDRPDVRTLKTQMPESEW